MFIKIFLKTHQSPLEDAEFSNHYFLKVLNKGKESRIYSAYTYKKCPSELSNNCYVETLI